MSILFTTYLYSQSNETHVNTNHEESNIAASLGLPLGYSNLLISDVKESRTTGLPVDGYFEYNKLGKKIKAYRTLSGFSWGLTGLIVCVSFAYKNDYLGYMALSLPFSLIFSLADLKCSIKFNTIFFNIKHPNDKGIYAVRKNKYIARFISTQFVASCLWNICSFLFITNLHYGIYDRYITGYNQLFLLTSVTGIIVAINLNLLGIRLAFSAWHMTDKKPTGDVFLGGSKKGIIAGYRMSF